MIITCSKCGLEHKKDVRLFDIRKSYTCADICAITAKIHAEPIDDGKEIMAEILAQLTKISKRLDDWEDES